LPSYLLRESASSLAREITSPPGPRPRPLTERLIDGYKRAHKQGKAPNASLIDAWDNSLPVVINSLNERGLGGVEVLVEFGLPHTNADVDVLLAGIHPGSGDLSYVLVELKQQREATVHPYRSVAVDLGYDHWKLHPVRQVQRYCGYLMQHKAMLRGRPDRLAGAVLMHNAHDDAVRSLFDMPANDHGRLYTLDRLEKFRKLLGSRLAPKPGGEAAEALIGSAEYEPPRITDVNLAFRGEATPCFQLLDEQELAHQDVHEAVSRARDLGDKQVIIVRGGPGSGKSAIALELRRTLAMAGWDVRHATGAKALTHTLRTSYVDAAARGTKTAAKREATQRFTYFNQLKRLAPDSCDVVVCDEAHRIRRHSIDRYTPKKEREDPRAQADEIIAAARVPVFLLDDWQSLRPEEVGSAEYLIERAKELGHQYTVIDLDGMFRAQGSAYFRDWVVKLLGIGAHTPQAWLPDGRMEVRVADSVHEMEDFLSVRAQEGADVRIVAGFCWSWSKPDDDGQLTPDVRIDGWERPWNAKPGSVAVDAPVAELWATDPRGVGQIGCAYTAQTFEFDWVGVILGPDLIWRQGRFHVDRAATHDPELRPRTIEDSVVTRCVLNAYHVLLTRGLMGVVLHSTDEETREALRAHVSGSVKHPLPKQMRKIIRD
jgi:hypothetical protein